MYFIIMIFYSLLSFSLFAVYIISLVKSKWRKPKTNHSSFNNKTATHESQSMINIHKNMHDHDGML